MSSHDDRDIERRVDLTTRELAQRIIDAARHAMSTYNLTDADVDDIIGSIAGEFRVDEFVCEGTVTDYTPGGREYTVPCGHYQGGRKTLCGPCNAKAEREYPQGWRGYPGDTCPHGVYVGGCGVDWMCGACEAGEVA